MAVTIESPKSRRKAFILQKDWTKGSVIRNLMLLSWPMVVMESLWVVSQISDLVWVGRLGSQAIAGVGVANILLMLVYSVDMGVITGVRAMVARHVGAGDTEGANRVAGQAVLFGVVWGLLVTLLGILLAGPILSLLGTDPEVVAEGAAYMRMLFVGWGVFEVMVMGLYAIQASGDTVRPMMIEGIMRAVHIALCPFLVLGIWIFPELGVRGAALSNVAGQTLGGIIIIWTLLTGQTRVRLKLRDLRIAPAIMWRLLKVGIPALIMNLQLAVGNIVLMEFVVPFGTMAVAAHSLTSRVEMFLFVPGIGLGAGAGVLVGQNLGAGQPKRAVRTAWLAVSFVQAFMMACCVAILILAEWVVGVFSADPEVIALGAMLLRIGTAGYLVMALAFVLQNSIAGAGDTIPIMIISIGAIWAIQLPLAFFLSRATSLGIYGVRWAMAANLVVSGIAYLTYFSLGRWKRKKI